MILITTRWQCLGLLALAFGLGGCASSSDGARSGVNPVDNVVTTSDEPETRKRARTRLELAANYFSEGKTTVALDEIKLSLVADPNYGDAFNMRGLIYPRLGDIPQAEASYRRED